MRDFNIDWQDLVSKLDVWKDIPREDKIKFLRMNSNFSELSSEFSESGLKRLLERGLLDAVHGGKKVKRGASARGFGKAMRNMSYHIFTVENSLSELQDYARDIFTYDERVCLIYGKNSTYNLKYQPIVSFNEVGASDWPRQILNMTRDQAIAWEISRLPSKVSKQFADGSPYLYSNPLYDSGKSLYDTLQHLMKTALSWQDPVALEKLTENIKDIDEIMLWTSVKASLRYMWLFAWLDEDFMPVIGVLPRIAYNINRKKPVLPKPVKTQETFHIPLLVEDMTSILVAAFSAPLRVKANSIDPYTKELDRIYNTTISLPNWVRAHNGTGNQFSTLETFSIYTRLTNGLEKCFDIDFLEIKQEGKLRTAEVTDEGKAWMDLDIKEKIKFMSAPWRMKLKRESSKKSNKNSKLLLTLPNGEDISFEDAGGLEIPWLSSFTRQIVENKSLAKIDWHSAVVDAFSKETIENFMPAIDTFNYHCRANNPFLGTREKGSYGPKAKIEPYITHQISDDIELEEVWCKELQSIFENELLPLGALEIGQDEQGTARFRLHSIGKYILGLADDFEYDAAPEGDIIIQPNFEVAFLGLSPKAEAIVGRLAERVGSGVGTLFKITKKSILAAADASIKKDQAIKDLQSISSKPIPDNVSREISGWFDSICNVCLRQVWIIEADDEQAAARARAAIGKDAKLLTPTKVELDPSKKRTTLIRRLKQKGVFVEK